MKQAPAALTLLIDDLGIAWLTLNRVADGNRFDAGMAVAMCEAAEQIEADAAVRVVVVNANGKDFCRGIDGDVAAAWRDRFDPVAAIGDLTKPVLAVIQGRASAEGCELALACDLRLAAHSACFRLPQLSEGRLPRCGATQRLPRLIGRMRALDLLLSGREVSASEAQDFGLVTQVVPKTTLQATARRQAGELAAKGPIALRYAKEAVLKGVDMTFEQGMRLEEDLYVLLQTTADRREGVDAFLQRRQPQFVGR